MTETPRYTLPEQTRRLMEAGRIKDTFTLLRRRLHEEPLPGLLNKVNQSENAYRYLLQYFRQGANDPGREDMMSTLRSDLLTVAERIDKEAMSAESSDIYFSTLRMCRLRPAYIPDLVASIVQKDSMARLAISAGEYPAQLEQEIETLEEKLFNTIWTSDSLTADAWSAASDAIATGTLPFTAASLAIAAAGLGLMRYYDSDALSLLIAAASFADDKVAARGVATLLLVLLCQGSRISGDRKAMEKLTALLETEGMPARFRKAVINAVRTRDTDRISRKMQRDVIPGLMQFGPDILKKMKSATQESALADLEVNPEWEELLRKSGLEDKLRELTELQQDGADVMMVPFSNLKAFPFFRSAHNWMHPFSVSHSSLRKLSEADNETLSAMLELNGMMCDSDKYSFAFSLASMPDAQRAAVMSQMKAQSEAIQEQMRDLEFLNGGKDFDNELIRYYRDLYRFHKLFSKKAEFFDPFAATMDFTSLPVVGERLGIEDSISPLAEFYFSRGYYEDALPLLEAVAKDSADAPHIWEKIGFALEKTGAPDEKAIEAYMKAQLFNPDSRWIARRLAGCFRRKGDYRNAVGYARDAMPADGSFDRQLSLLLADTLAEAGKWEEALTELYRADYETPDDPEVRRRMAMSAMRMKQLDKAAELIGSIDPLALSEDDYRLMGHIEMLNGNFSKAMEKYRLTVRPNDTKRRWKTAIMADAPMLEQLGASRTDLALMMEALAYDLEN
ncbi:MAG: tetratricopeptide repeat protein [Muribaculaceae bacterium]|nr:tetratricopeptide repeat protein [Muribaculaceae bacterium]